MAQTKIWQQSCSSAISWQVILSAEWGTVSVVTLPLDENQLGFDSKIVGIQLVLYTSCAIYLWGRRKQNRQLMFLLAYITLLLSVETIFVAVQANTVQIVYVDNRAYPGGPWAFFLATQNLPVNIMFYATLFVLTFLSDMLVVCTQFTS